MTIKEKIFFFVVGSFLVIGNLPRFIPLTIGFGNVNMGEVFLYAITLSLFPLRIFGIFKSPIARILITGTLVSLLVGIYKWGADPASMSYAIRFVMQISIATLAGEILAKRFAGDIQPIKEKYFFAYFMAGILAIALLIIFPDSAVLWAALASIGVEFTGDPHIGRLVSLYFDPNFYAVIIALPITLLYAEYITSKRKIILIYLLILTGTLFLTVSRSGIALLGFIAVIFAIKGFIRFSRKLIIKKTTVRNAGVFFIAILIVLIASQDQVDRLLDRLSSGVGDESSTARLDSFVIGMGLFLREPILGYGYNFVNPFLVDTGRLGLDSSLQVFLITYGTLIACTMTLFLAWQLIIINKRMKILIEGKAPDKHKPTYEAWRIFGAYVLFCLIWASHFNQIIFYPFWIIPILSFLFYFEFLGKILKQHKNRYRHAMSF